MLYMSYISNTIKKDRFENDNEPITFNNEHSKHNNE